LRRESLWLGYPKSSDHPCWSAITLLAGALRARLHDRQLFYFKKNKISGKLALLDPGEQPFRASSPP